MILKLFACYILLQLYSIILVKHMSLNQSILVTDITNMLEVILDYQFLLMKLMCSKPIYNV